MPNFLPTCVPRFCSKLASFMQTDEETFRTYLLLYKHKTRNLVWKSGPPLSGEYETGADVDFYLNGVWLALGRGWMCCLLGRSGDILFRLRVTVLLNRHMP